MANQINPPRGMRDFLPQEKSMREAMLAKIRSLYVSLGFQEIETPALEELERLSSGQGGDNEKLVFKVQKRGQEFESALAQNQELADLGLRFDLTVPLTRFYASHHSKLPKVFKAIQIGPVWRAERPQKGRYRQFMQCDIDIVGDPSHLAELELLSAALSALAALGLKEATIRVNHRELLTNNILSLGISAQDALSAMISIDKLDKIGIAGVANELGDKFGAEVSQRATLWLSDIDQAAIPELLAPLFEGLAGHARLRFDPSLVRGMGYYTGSIFEIEHPESGSSIGGGGRYDSMVGKYLGVDVPAVGISLGIERIMELVAPLESKTNAVVLLIPSPQFALAALKLQAQGVASGYRVRIELRQKNLKTQLDDMQSQGFEFFAELTLEASFSELNLKALG
ncbi:histidine--tRNA ligase [Candidatus Aquiluna sp. UB-MaderosW2red]|uniref:histidine--tRNA ligase n=1 Tax=Candidatus Aquiluna sp. UB-MaderosW2red TaxID=1855377 RepID=UPI000875C29D|nr:histidine--tRNA ligase [Candidatus Aquiluna sp. UB-MaderosW2red]SCX08771.1 histidyl-tRNA synthetase [Candidatus Aquiluna sp. UB-MaderosW2red]